MGNVKLEAQHGSKRQTTKDDWYKVILSIPLMWSLLLPFLFFVSDDREKREEERNEATRSTKGYVPKSTWPIELSQRNQQDYKLFGLSKEDFEPLEIQAKITYKTFEESFQNGIRLEERISEKPNVNKAKDALAKGSRTFPHPITSPVLPDNKNLKKSDAGSFLSGTAKIPPDYEMTNFYQTALRAAWKIYPTGGVYLADPIIDSEFANMGTEQGALRTIVRNACREAHACGYDISKIYDSFLTNCGNHTFLFNGGSISDLDPTRDDFYSGSLRVIFWLCYSVYFLLCLGFLVVTYFKGESLSNLFVTSVGLTIYGVVCIFLGNFVWSFYIEGWENSKKNPHFESNRTKAEVVKKIMNAGGIDEARRRAFKNRENYQQSIKTIFKTDI